MHQISIKIGISMLAGFIAYFLLLYVMGLGYRTELRIVNVGIQLFCIYKAIRGYYAIYPKTQHNYLLGVAEGMWTSAIGIGGFAVFMTVFLALNPIFMDTVAKNSIVGAHLNPYTASLFIVTEGLIVGLIGSYLFTRVSEDEPITKDDKLT